MLILNPFSADPTTYSYTDTYYCPQTTPDQTITFTIVLNGDSTNYCPQTVPDYNIGVFSTQTDTNYCPQDYDGSPAVLGQSGQVSTALYRWRLTHYYANGNGPYVNTNGYAYGPCSIQGEPYNNRTRYFLYGRNTANGPIVKTEYYQEIDVNSGGYIVSLTYERMDGTSEANDILQDPNASAAVPGFYDINYTINTSTQTDTNYCPQDSGGFYDFAQAP